MKNISLPLHLQEASLLGEDGLIYASVEITTREGHALDLALREGHHESLPPAQRKKLYAEARAIAWETAAAQLRRLADRATKKADRLRRTPRYRVTPSGQVIPLSATADWQATRARCS